MEIFKQIEKLICYGIQNELIEKEDKIYARNLILEKLNLSVYENIILDENQVIDHIKVLEYIIEYAYINGIIESIKPPFSDLFDTAIMGCLIPRPSEVNKTFWQFYKNSPKSATDYYYKFSKASNYIRTNRTDKNIEWVVTTDYGNINITINLSKPEKDPKAIAIAKNQKNTGYPKCLLCYENVGYEGNINHPARQNHRVIPIELNNEKWYLQYSPYVYFNEHSIVFKEEHVPMIIKKSSFNRLLDFVDLFPHYFIGSNADLPIVGGSMLSHDHYQSGCFEFPMDLAVENESYLIDNFNDVEVVHLKWPLTVIRLRSKNRNQIIKLAGKITNTWREYSDEINEVLSFSNNEKHNTVTPIARKNRKGYEVDIVLRNNRTSIEYPYGIFHPHKEIHPVKKENIGLIEVMGLAVLPPRLVKEMFLLEEALLNDTDVEVIRKSKAISTFYKIYEEMIPIYKKNRISANELIRSKIGEVFVKGLEHSGVFKQNKNGYEAFGKFMISVNDGK